VTAYGCDDGIPKDSSGNISKADLNYNGAVSAVSSNRLIVKADADGDVCFYTLTAAEMIVDINGVTDTGVTAIPNQRTDTRTIVTTTTTQPATTATTQPAVPGNPGDTASIWLLGPSVPRATCRARFEPWLQRRRTCKPGSSS
jgi:hypothetical protein